jgi:hypothetical protein
MAEFTITRASSRPAGATFARLVDWDAHSAAIPLTRLSHTGTPGRGQRFVARTGWARWGFDDPMEVELLRPPTGDRPGDLPGLVEVRKTGRVVAGTVRWTVTPAPGGAVVEWRQVLRIPWLPRWLDPLVGVAGRVAYAAGLRRLLR